jgi:hypothetical protein
MLLENCTWEKAGKLPTENQKHKKITHTVNALATEADKGRAKLR